MSDCLILLEDDSGFLALEDGAGLLLLEDCVPAPVPVEEVTHRRPRRRRPAPPPVKPSPPFHGYLGTARVYVFASQPRLAITASPSQATAGVRSHRPDVDRSILLPPIQINARTEIVRDVARDTRLAAEDVWAAARMSTGRPTTRATGRPN